MKKVFIKAIALVILAALSLSLASCGMKEYSRLGISFKIPSGYEEKAISGAKMAFGDDESFIVFNKYTAGELSAIGLGLGVREYTERFLEQTKIGVDDPTYNASETRAEFSYVVKDPDNDSTYYYYYVLILKGDNCIWAVQMACYADLIYKYEDKFVDWAEDIDPTAE